MTNRLKKLKSTLPLIFVVMFAANALTGCCCPCCWGGVPTPDPGTGGQLALPASAMAAPAGPVGHATAMPY